MFAGCKLMAYKIEQLKNGVCVVANPMKERKSVSIGIWAHVGGRNETPKESGISHFLEHLVFKGTKTRTANQIKEAVEGVGGSLNAFTGEEYTAFVARIASRHFPQVFEVLAEMVLDASLKKEDVNKERTVIMEEIKMTQDQPSQLADELLGELVWPKHALGRPLAGTLETVGAINEKHLSDYRDRYYHGNRISIVAAGNIHQKALVKISNTYFSKNAKGQPAPTETFRERQTEPQLKLHYKKTEQTHLAMALHALPRGHEDEYALELLNVALGGNMSSRLFNEVREERGLAYDIGSFTRKYNETGVFGVSAGVDHGKINEALSVILKELEKTAREAVRADELRRAKEFYIGQLQLGLESSMSHMLWMGEQLVTQGRCTTAEEIVRKVEKVTAADIKRIAQKIFKTRAINLAVVGPIESDKQLQKQLQF